MGDVFIEKIVKKQKDSKDYFFISGIIFLALVLIFIVFMFINYISVMTPFVVAGIIWGAYRLITSRNKEFEYIVTNGDLDIDMIIARRKRKRIFSASCKTFDIIAKVKSDKYDSRIENIPNRVEAVSSLDAENVFFATLHYKGNSTVVYFEANKKMLDNFKLFIKSKIFE